MISFRNIDFDNDLDQIVQLLRTSLSENHSVESFKWKHLENPFGKSFGLLACDQDKIVGVRMFMYWKFRKGDKLNKAVRPVDTIVHPSYRGKGLFKRLTLQGLEACKATYDLVFNTPNNNSLPGYLKMGWKEYPGKLDYFVALSLPALKTGSDFEIQKEVRLSDFEDYNPSISFRTETTSEFLKWRYKDSVYHFVQISSNRNEILIIYRKEKLWGIPSLIIMDIIGGACHNYFRVLRLLSFHLKIFSLYVLKSNLGEVPLLARRSSGSTVVYRDDQYDIIKEVNFSAGDLEGKL